MAVTRIKNNQITDATINAAAKVTSYSITSGLIANNLTYGSDLTITGNLTVNGNTTTIDTVDLIVEDPVIILAANQTGSPSVDIGFIGKRGTSTNVAFVWDESAGAFLTAFTNSASTNTVIAISSYADFLAANITANTNLSVVGTTSLTGNVIGTNTNFTGNITVGNLINNGAMSTTGNVTGGNLNTGGIVSATGNVNGGNINTAGAVSATGNITGGNLNISGNIVDTGALTIITGSSGNVNLAPNGTNVLIATTTGANITGTLNATGNANVGNLGTAGLITATGNITGGNVIASALVQGVTVSASGNVVGGNANITSAVNSATVSATGNITGGNINTAGLVSATGNVNGGNVNTTSVRNTSALTVATTSGNINLTPAGNVVLSNTYINSVAYPAQDQDAASKLYVDNMVSTQISYHQAVNVASTTTMATTTGGTITYTQPNGASNGVGALLTTTGSFNLIDSANVQTVGTRILIKNEANAVFNGVYTWANATNIVRSTDADEYGPNSSTQLSLNDYFFVTGGVTNEGSAWIVDNPTGTITFGTSNIAFAQFSSSQVYEANTSAGLSLTGTTFSAKVDNNTTAFDGGGNISVKAGANLTTPNIGAATGTSLSVTGNITGGNLNTGGLVSATGNISGGNLISAALVQGVTVSASGNVVGGNLTTAGLITATGNITGGNLNTGAQVVATGNITGGNLITAGLATITGNVNTGAGVLATGNVTGGNVNTAGLITATGNITGGNINTGAQVVATGNITGGNITTTGQANLGNIRISGDTITGTNGRVNINSAAADVDFSVSGTAANVFYVDAGANSASFGNSTQITNAIVAFNTTTSIAVPKGTTSQRPGTGVTGMVRFNTSINNLEFYDANSWQTAGSTFTVITANTQTGDGTTVAFTLPAASTTAGTIVAINGVVQIPITAYSVSNVTCTFTEAPASTDVIDFRVLATTSTVTGLSSASGATLQLDPTKIELDVTGNIVPIGNVTYTIGNSTGYWNNIYSSSLTVGNIVNTNANGVGNIGTSSGYFNTIFAKATSAQYADLAEKYVADAEYAPGTVLEFGGDKEVTLSTVEGSTRVAGVVSTNPSYIMNAGLTGEHVAMVALQGRVPCHVVGAVSKGDLMVAAGNGAAKTDNNARAGTIIGKALENFDGAQGTIEVVIGRN